LAIWFPAPRSFTGEDVVELHLHGGRAVLVAVCDELAKTYGLRAAAPGEFTHRAFDNGKLDLTAVEGLADLIAADTQAQRRQALHQLGGGIYRLYESWRGRLITVLAQAEAEIEFPDEGLPDGIASSVNAELSAVLIEMRRHLDDSGKGERLRHGLSVAIIGPPNVGKSSLLNLLAGRDVAIVSTRAGTTRDILEVNLELGGYPVTVADTAGIREAEDEIEIEGVRRSRQRAQNSEIRIAMTDVAMGQGGLVGLEGLIDKNTILVVNKVDLGVPNCISTVSAAAANIHISAKTGAGIDLLLATLEKLASERLASGSEAVVTMVRHRQAIEDVLTCLERAVESKRIDEFVAEEIRLATRSIGRVMGQVDVEQVLDVLFREFCIGK
jgi:tRNA modification GTPase